MSFREKTIKSEIVIDFTGPEGNAFCLLGYAKKFARQLGLDENKIHSEMTSGNYEDLLQVFNKYFGDFVVLER